jgi:prepilin-type N-terminal cleavage/methylation domain-containing protein
MKNSRKQNGFTLLEVLISVTILAFISVFTAQSLRRSSQYKIKIQKDVDHRAQLRSTLRLIERDVNMAFHYRGASWRIVAAIQQMMDPNRNGQNTVPGQQPQFPQQPNQPGQPGQPPQATPLPPYPRPTQFIGKETTLSLVTLSNFRTLVDSAVSDQLRVSYRLDNCPEKPKALGAKPPEGKCLLRKTSNWILDEETSGSGIFKDLVLIDGIKDLKFRYFGPGRDEWVNTWQSDQSGDALSQNRFPEAVEISITSVRENKELTLSTVASLRFPNNSTPAEDAAATGGAPGNTTGATNGGGIGSNTGSPGG